jgi:hypothetical protein
MNKEFEEASKFLNLINYAEEQACLIMLEDVRRKLESIPEGPLQPTPKQNRVFIPSFEFIKNTDK